MVTKKPPEKVSKDKRATKSFFSAPWVKIALVVLGLLIMGGGIGFYFLRRSEKPPAASPSQQSTGGDVIKAPAGDLAASIQIFTNENELTTAVQLVDVNLLANTRQIVWFYTDSSGLAQAYTSFDRTKPSSTPWMTSDLELTARQIALLNGNFDCVEVAKTGLATSIVGITDYVAYVCAVAVPPDYGKFSGYISAWMARVPNVDEQGRLIERLRSFSAQLGAAQAMQ